MDFDLAVLESAEVSGNGLIFIVETFAGKRTYYGCTSDEVSFRHAFSEVLSRFVGHDCSVEFCQDRAWTFYRDYREQFEW